jgi:hypothetical protein
MKRNVIASVLVVLGSIAIVASSFGQGTVVFANYTTPSGTGPTFDPGVNAPVTYTPVGVRIGSEFTASLLFSLDGGANYTALSQAAAGAGSAYPTPFLATDGDDAHGAGYFQGPNVTIPGYSSGPITFIVQAYHGSSYAAADFKGQSAPFTLNSIATGLTVPGDFGQVGGTGGFLQPFVIGVPEPSVFALAGLGAAGLIAFRRKK